MPEGLGARFFFIETSEGYVDPHVVHLPEPANAEPSTTESSRRSRPQQYQKKLEVPGARGEQKAMLVMHAAHELKEA